MVYVRRGMPSSPLENTYDRTKSCVTFHHFPLTRHTVGRCRVLNVIISLRLHTRTDYVRHGMPSSPLDNIYGLKKLGMAFHHFPLTRHSQTTSGVACHHSPKTTLTFRCFRVWQLIMDHGQHTWSDGDGRSMLLSPLNSTYSRTTSGMEYHHSPWKTDTVGRRWA